MTTFRFASALALTAIVLTSACTPIELAPPEAPARELPAINADIGPPAPGSQRVVLDTPGDRARVTETIGSFESYSRRGTGMVTENDRMVCVTPCAIDLSYGAHELHFASTTSTQRSANHTVQVQGEPLVVRELMEETRTPNPGAQSAATASTVISILSLGAAGVLGFSGAMLDTSPNNHDDGVRLERAAVMTASVGVVLGIAAIVFSVVGRSEHVPSATTEWAVPSARP